MPNENPYLNIIHHAMPRILGMVNMNPVSDLYGIADRYRWGWKLIDYANGKSQGLACGLSVLLNHNLLPKNTSTEEILAYIDALFSGLPKATYRNGSLAEAYPYENSFALTAFVANDLMEAIINLRGHVSEEVLNGYIEKVRPLFTTLNNSSETHGIICNHLAGAAAAYAKLSKVTNTPLENRGKELINTVLSHQDEEGWYLEYEGADPGYQTFCTGYLASIYEITNDQKIKKSIEKSLNFLSHCLHPDGSFAGLYGARNARFFAPYYAEAMANDIPMACSIANFAATSIQNRRIVSLESVDDNNLAPFFNNMCLAAAAFEQRKEKSKASPDLPHESSENLEKTFPNAGFYIRNNKKNYTVVSLKKGGVVYHFDKEKKSALINAGAVYKNGKRFLTTQTFEQNIHYIIEKNKITVTSFLTEANNATPTPLSFIIFRLLNVSLMRVSFFNELVKKALVKLLITRKSKTKIKNIRQIKFEEDIEITDKLENDHLNLKKERNKPVFSCIHMASQGYWQSQKLDKSQ